jgi:hypothetical protein
MLLLCQLLAMLKENTGLHKLRYGPSDTHLQGEADQPQILGSSDFIRVTQSNHGLPVSTPEAFYDRFPLPALPALKQWHSSQQNHKGKALLVSEAIPATITKRGSKQT